jgi:hypothetical protein
MKPERTVSFREQEMSALELGQTFIDKWYTPELQTCDSMDHVFLGNVGETLKYIGRGFPKSDPDWGLPGWEDRLSLLSIYDMYHESGHSRIFKNLWQLVYDKIDTEKMRIRKGERVYVREYDYLVTTPISKRDEHIKEAEDAIALYQKTGELDYYYRDIHPLPKNLKIGSKMFYVDNRAVRGFAVVTEIDPRTSQVRMSVDTWRWIKPLPANYFIIKPPQSYASALNHTYFKGVETVKVVGDWLEPMYKHTPKKSDKEVKKRILTHAS